jgi:ureidoglycolate dehydrogenase (NAD+)
MRVFVHDRLAHLMHVALEARNVGAESRKHVVHCLIQTSLRGVDSHGINLFPHYCRAIDAGRINPNPVMKLTSVGTSAAIIDADDGFGHHAGAYAMTQSIELAKSSGIGAVGVTGSTHFSAAAYYGLMAAEADCIGFAFTNADALVKAENAKVSFLGTNPICFTAPLLSEGPLCLDMATSLVSWNKIMNFRRENKQIQSNWAFDSVGKSVTNPELAVSLNPVGGYKGFGLGLMVEILCSTLNGGVLGKEIAPMYSIPLTSTKRKISHFFAAIDVGRFCGVQHFKETLQNIVSQIRQLPPTEDNCDVMVPGDPEKKTYIERSLKGIPLDESKFQEFIAVNAQFSDALAR